MKFPFRYKTATTLLVASAFVAIAAVMYTPQIKDVVDNNVIFHDMDRYLDKGDLYGIECPDVATFSLEGNKLTALCNGEGYYTEYVDDPEEYQKIISIKTNMALEHTNITLLRMYMGSNQFKLVEIWVFDWDKMKKGGCLIINNHYATCEAYSKVWQRQTSVYHSFKVGDHIYGTEEAGKLIGDLIPAGAEAIVLETNYGHLIKIRLVSNGQESTSNAYWFTTQKP